MFICIQHTTEWEKVSVPRLELNWNWQFVYGVKEGISAERAVTQSIPWVGGELRGARWLARWRMEGSRGRRAPPRSRSTAARLSRRSAPRRHDPRLRAARSSLTRAGRRWRRRPGGRGRGRGAECGAEAGEEPGPAAEPSRARAEPWHCPSAFWLPGSLDWPEPERRQRGEPHARREWTGQDGTRGGAAATVASDRSPEPRPPGPCCPGRPRESEEYENPTLWGTPGAEAGAGTRATSRPVEEKTLTTHARERRHPYRRRVSLSWGRGKPPHWPGNRLPEVERGDLWLKEAEWDRPGASPPLQTHSQHFGTFEAKKGGMPME